MRLDIHNPERSRAEARSIWATLQRWRRVAAINDRGGQVLLADPDRRVEVVHIEPNRREVEDNFQRIGFMPEDIKSGMDSVTVTESRNPSWPRQKAWIKEPEIRRFLVSGRRVAIYRDYPRPGEARFSY